MIRRLLTTFLSIIFVFLTLGNINVSAQESPNNKLFFSPSIKVVEYFENQEQISDSISVTNGFDRNVSVKFTPAIVQIVNGEIEIIEDENLTDKIRIAEPSISLSPDQTSSIDIVINNPDDFVENKNPAILVSESSGNINEQVEITPRIASVFIIENVDANVEFEVYFDVVKSSIIDPEYTVIGRIENTGERVISPSGVINIYKQQTKFQSIELTSDIYTSLLPGQSISFERRGSFDFGDLIKDTGRFTVEVSIKPNPFSNVLNKSQTVIHFHRTIFIGVVTGSIVSLILIIYLTTIILNQEKRDNLKENIKKTIPFKKNPDIVKQEKIKKWT